jgi:tetratricopeptide (TPR) repeat protein
MANDGRLEEAAISFDRALQSDPESPTILYVRAMVLAKTGKTEEAISDLRKAISLEPALRFQLVNDSDFEVIRDEATFIDLIEPTPSGA